MNATMTTTCLESGKIYQSTCLEEHIVMIGEPSEYYLSHFFTEDGKGSFVADGIYSVMKGMDLEKNLAVIGTDGASMMTGINKGCIRKWKKLFRGHCCGRFASYIEMSFFCIMFLLNWMEVQKVQKLLLAQSAKIGLQCLTMASCCFHPFLTHISKCYPVMFLKTLAQTNIMDIRFVGQ